MLKFDIKMHLQALRQLCNPCGIYKQSWYWRYWRENCTLACHMTRACVGDYRRPEIKTRESGVNKELLFEVSKFAIIESYSDAHSETCITCSPLYYDSLITPIISLDVSVQPADPLVLQPNLTSIISCKCFILRTWFYYNWSQYNLQISVA